jgi:hypothetical protein
VPVPEKFRALATRPEFWSRYFWESEEGEFPELERCKLRFPVGRRHALVLEMDEDIFQVTLRLKAPGSRKPVQIAWDDQSHWHPHVLRWEELDLVGRCVALDDPTLPHPGLVVALLHRFTPICRGDRLDVVHPLITEAYRAVGVFSEKQVREAVYSHDQRQYGFAWARSEVHGWYPRQEGGAGACELYSLRHPESDEFPFAAFNGMVEAARRRLKDAVDPAWLSRNGGEVRAVAEGIAASGHRSGLPALADALEEAGCENRVILDGLRSADFPARGCWVVELLLRLEPGSVIARALGRTRRKERVVYVFDLDVPCRRRGREDPTLFHIERPLNAALAADNLGSAYAHGGRSAEGREGYDEVAVRVDVRDDLGRGLAIIRRVLRDAGASRRTVIELMSPRRARYRLYPSKKS